MKLEELVELKTRIAFDLRGYDLAGTVSQSLNLLNLSEEFLEKVDVTDAYFLGCDLCLDAELRLRTLGANVFSKIKGTLYNPYRTSLYCQKELRADYVFQKQLSLDQRIYRHFSDNRGQVNLVEALARRIHDHAVDDALQQYLMTKRKSGVAGIIGIMGGAGKPRTDPSYREVAYLSRALTEQTYLVVSGGGPGMMEAANLGAYFADRPIGELDAAIAEMSRCPVYNPKREDRYTVSDYLDVAYQVADGFDGAESLSISTWSYGEEPTNAFATRVAKYFSNSIREDGLSALCREGVLFDLLPEPRLTGSNSDEPTMGAGAFG